MFNPLATTTSGFGGFGNNVSTGLFGQSAVSQPAQQSTSLFGTVSFGGATQQTPAPIFSGFGVPQTQPQISNIFSGTGTQLGSIFSTQQAQPGTPVKFVAPSASESVSTNGSSKTVTTRNQVITFMKQYENKSFEELRMEDYQLNRKGPQKTGLFANITPTTTTVQPLLFPSPTTGANLFGTPAKTGTIFSSGTTTTTPFTSFGIGANNTGFTFAANQPQQNIFSANKTTTSTPANSAPLSFSFNPQQQQQSQSLWNQPQPTTAPVFGFGNKTPAFATPQAAPQQPLFSFATNTANQQQPQVQPWTFKPFANAPAQTPTVNTTPQSPFAVHSSNLHSNPLMTPVPAPGFSLFGTPTAPQNVSFAAPNRFTAPTFGFQAPVFGTNANNTAVFTPARNGTASTFLTGEFMGGFSLEHPFNRYIPESPYKYFPQMQPNNQALVPFATTPYKDNPQFSNLISTTSLEKMTKPTSPVAMRLYLDSRRKEPRHSVAGLSVFNLDSGPFWSNFTNMAPSDRSSAAVRKKPAIFDGFEDEDEQNQLYGINLLAPKRTNNWKRLILNSAQAATGERNNGPSPAKMRNFISLMTVKDGTSFNFNNTADSETDGEAGGGGDAELEQQRWATKAKFKDDLNKSISGIEARRQSSTGFFRISQIVDDDPEPVRSCGVVCTRPGYYINPSVDELDKMMNETGKCFVVGFEIGRHGFGKVNFILPVNVAGLNVDETVIIEHQSIEVYPEGSKRPLLYEGLNGPALVELERIWPINKETKEPIRCLKKIYERGVEKKLKKTCADLGVEFISYNDETGVWKFQVAHF